MDTPCTSTPTKQLVVVGNGMVGHRFCEKLVEKGVHQRYQISVFCEEPRLAYDRVSLTQYFSGRTAQDLALAKLEWYGEKGIQVHVGDPVVAVDRRRGLALSRKGFRLPYHHLVLATGSVPFVPPLDGIDKKGVFTYRTVEDLEAITAWAQQSPRAAVIGGGLLGLEAAKALVDLGLETSVVEYSDRLMPRQLDSEASRLLVGRIEALGVRVLLGRTTSRISGNGRVEALHFQDGSCLEMGLLIVSAGIKPRDGLARSCGLQVGERGGVVVDDRLTTSDPGISAIGEVALHRGMIYGLVAPGYEMAEVLAARLAGEDRTFGGGDLSAKLKLMGVEVASFGDAFGTTPDSRNILYKDELGGTYKRLTLSGDGKNLLGGMLIGDASRYGQLHLMMKQAAPLPLDPAELIAGVGKGSGKGGFAAELPDVAQICSCNGVAKEALVLAVKGGCTKVEELKKCTRAGTGCGGCLPLVTDILKTALRAEGRQLSNHLCEHFPYTRQELFDIVKINKVETFGELISTYGQGYGCEICKPAVASILASTWNAMILEHESLQDTNDRFLANIQRGGTYSVVPRIPGGEITPGKLIALGQVAQKYNLYCKITGGQRIDLLGARVDQLPQIWEELIAAGFESGHAYGKAMRTVKSCVGTTWCRYAVQDSTAFAIRIEHRYKGIRAPHKLKAACSGCVRECAEAQSKDFGVVATEKGWNLYVGGNGGALPQHGVLLAGDLDEQTCIKYIDRFLMYYIYKADRLARTATWLNQLEGGIEYLRQVVVEDHLGIGAQLEQDIQRLMDNYQCEWKAVVEDPEKRKRFRHFVNSDAPDDHLQWRVERDQRRPAPWDEAFKETQIGEGLLV
ncbi:MAG: nitrite reductase large subunit [Candidatus Handelsmanbacteria bacterium]|nr:nitrite reductase large subunit [Candidatus Handelsmanbacteria bacterium]